MKLAKLLMCIALALTIVTASVIATNASYDVLTANQYTLTDIDKGVLGDATGDGEADIRDVTLIQMKLCKMISFEHKQNYLSDVNEDGKVDILDVTYIQMYDVGYILTLRIGQIVDIPKEQEETSESTAPTTDGGWLPGYFD